ncbi:MAG: hypothetical protein ACC608_12495 [Anaerofustis sp.]
MMRKKILSFIFIVLFAATAAGCMSDSVNDPSTGEIITYQNKYQYIDGTYVAYGTYYNDNGYVPALLLTVQNGIVVCADFDLFDAQGNRYSQNASADTSEDRSLFRTEVKSLNSALLQSQNYTQLDTGSATGELYQKLASVLFPLLISGDTTPAAVDMALTYHASAAANAYGYYPMLSVTYSDAIITKIEFVQLDAQNNNIVNLKEYTDTYRAKNGITYQDALAMLETIPDDSATLTKTQVTGIDKDLLSTYNKLASAVSAKHQIFQSDPTSLFSSK